MKIHTHFSVPKCFNTPILYTTHLEQDGVNWNEMQIAKTNTIWNDAS